MMKKNEGCMVFNLVQLKFNLLRKQKKNAWFFGFFFCFFLFFWTVIYVHGILHLQDFFFLDSDS